MGGGGGGGLSSIRVNREEQGGEEDRNRMSRGSVVGGCVHVCRGDVMEWGGDGMGDRMGLGA